MDEMIDRAVLATGLDSLLIAPAVALLLAYLIREASPGAAMSLLAAVPGVA